MVFGRPVLLQPNAVNSRLCACAAAHLRPVCRPFCSISMVSVVVGLVVGWRVCQEAHGVSLLFCLLTTMILVDAGSRR